MEDSNEQQYVRALDYADVCGQEMAKRAVTVAVAGGHGLLMSGSPGTGKTMVAERITGILPPLSGDERLELTEIYSVKGELDARRPAVGRRPFRQPHQSITKAALIGGGMEPYPGEISLAHRGVLFLDELPEFKSSVLESLRTPLEKHMVSIQRNGVSYNFPADFLFVAAANPCPCGYYGDPNGKCNCSASDIRRYRKKLSGPLKSRIDLSIFLPPVKYEQLKEKSGMSSCEMREMVIKAREIQKKRFGNSQQLNAHMSSRQVGVFAKLNNESEALLKNAYEQLKMDPRIMNKTIKVARTIADIDGCCDIKVEHLTEALAYRK